MLDNPDNGVWVLAEHKMGQLAPISLELLGIGRHLADELDVYLAAVLLGSDIASLAEELIFHGADKVYLTEAPALSRYQTRPYQKVVEDLIRQHEPEIVLFGASAIGGDLAPRLACSLNTGLSAHCIDLKIDKSSRQLIQICPFFDFIVTIVCDTKPQMATVQLGVIPPLPREPSRNGEIIRTNADIETPDVELINVEAIKETGAKIEDASVVIAAGRGVKDISLVEELARVLGGVVGATLPIVDEGILPESHLIGQTGKTVRPKLYIGCGISGAGQHVVGMENAEVIVAINKDASASIFKVADYGIVGDLHQIVPALIFRLTGSAQT